MLAGASGKVQEAGMFYISPNLRALKESVWEIISKDDSNVAKIWRSHSQLKLKALLIPIAVQKEEKKQTNKQKKENIRQRCTFSKGP